MTDVIVIGAGVAGLAAARRLAAAGLRVTVLEASDRVGGRIRSIRQHGLVLELGAEFVHGRPAELWALIEEAGLATYERTGEFLPAHDDEESDTLEGLESFAGPDCSFAEYVARLGLSEEQRAAEIGYVEGFNAADAREASALALGVQQKAEDAIEGDRMWRLVDGYDSLTEYLRGRVEAAGGAIVFGARVVRVEWNVARVKATVADGRIFEAARCVVTLPLGVLQTGDVAFEPAVLAIAAAAKQMRMGQVCRFTLVFKRRLWAEAMSFLMTPELLPSVWWSARPNEERSLTGWVGGPTAAALLAEGSDALREHAARAAAQALGMGTEALTREIDGFHTHDWQADPLAKGAYSWVPVGGLEASAAMSQPVEDVLFFAGEHTDTTGHWGTVHAALGSGLRAADQVLERTGVSR